MLKQKTGIRKWEDGFMKTYEERPLHEQIKQFHLVQSEIHDRIINPREELYKGGFIHEK